MTKRSYKRRTADEQVADLEAQILALKSRQLETERSDKPVVTSFPKLKKQLAAFAQLCMDYGRGDVSNSVMAFMSMAERQVSKPPQ